MQRNQRTPEGVLTAIPGRFGPLSQTHLIPSPSSRPPAIAPPAAKQQAEPQAERPTFFAALCRCLVRARRDQPIGGEGSPLLWW